MIITNSAFMRVIPGLILVKLLDGNNYIESPAYDTH